MVKVKICGLTRREDVLCAVEAGADSVGVVFEPNTPRCVTLEQARELFEGVSATKVAVFGTLRDLGDWSLFDAVQFLDDPLDLASNLPLHLKIIRGFRLVSADVPPIPSRTDFLHIEPSVAGKMGGTGVVADWDMAAQVVAACPLPVVLAGGLKPENVAAAIAQVNPYMVDTSSGVEVSPGIKDPARIRAYATRARA